MPRVLGSFVGDQRGAYSVDRAILACILAVSTLIIIHIIRVNYSVDCLTDFFNPPQCTPGSAE